MTRLLRTNKLHPVYVMQTRGLQGLLITFGKQMMLYLQSFFFTSEQTFIPQTDCLQKNNWKHDR